MSLAIAEPIRKSLRKPQPRVITPKLAEALRLIIHDGKDFQEAAEYVGITTRRIRQAIAMPHVQRFIRAEQEVRLATARLDNISDLARIKKGDGAAAVTAIRALEEMAAPEAARVATSAQTLPGVTINIISNQPQSDEGQHVQPMVIEHEPEPASGSLVDRSSSQAKKSSVKKAGGKNPSRPARS